jgi:hypothetical protein
LVSFFSLEVAGFAGMVALNTTMEAVSLFSVEANAPIADILSENRTDDRRRTRDDNDDYDDDRKGWRMAVGIIYW